jgi:chemotaxis protein CheC
MADQRILSDLERDALREVANIGAGHAATALSQMTSRKIMISVPEVSVRRLEEVAELVGPSDS